MKFVTNSCSRANCFPRTCVPSANSSPTNCIGHVCICESCGMKYVAHLRSRASRANFLPRTCVRVWSARPRTALVTFLCANRVEWNTSRTRVLEQLSPTNLCFEFAHPRTYYAPRMRHVRTRKNCVPTNSPYFMFVLYVHIYIYTYTYVCKHTYINACLHINIYTYVYKNVYIYICITCIYVYICIHIRIYIHTYMYIYIYIYEYT